MVPARWFMIAGGRCPLVAPTNGVATVWFPMDDAGLHSAEVKAAADTDGGERDPSVMERPRRHCGDRPSPAELQQVESEEDDGLPVFIGQHVHMLLGDPPANYVGPRLEDNPAGLLPSSAWWRWWLDLLRSHHLEWVFGMKLHTALNLDTTIKDYRLGTLSWWGLPPRDLDWEPIMPIMKVWEHCTKLPRLPWGIELQVAVQLPWGMVDQTLQLRGEWRRCLR